jgi:putative ABC transport system permease protein
MSAVVRMTVAGLRRRGLAQVLVLASVAALAATAIVAGLAAQQTSADLVDAAYQRANQPDLVLTGAAGSLRTIAGDDGVAEASEPTPVLEPGTVDVDGDDVDLVLRGIDPDALPTVGTPELLAGRWPAPGATNEVVVEQSLVAEGVTGIGEELAIDRPGGAEPVTLEVVGAAIDLADCFWPTCDPLRAFAHPELLDELGWGSGDDPGTFLASFRLVDPDQAMGAHGRYLGDAELGVGGNAWPDTRDDILVIGGVFSALLGGFGIFLLATACLVVAGATAARMVARRRSLGLLQAIGFRPGQLAAGVLAEHLIIGAGGVLVGWALGSLLSPVVQPGVDGIVGEAGASFDPASLLVALVLVEGFLAASVLAPAWRAGRQSPTAVLRDAPATPGGGRFAAGIARALGAGP